MKTQAKVLAVLLVLIALPIMAGLFPTAPHIATQFSSVPTNQQYTLAAGTTDYIDQVSNVDSHADHGTHDIFADLQAYDLTYDTMAEAVTSDGTNTQDYIDSTSDVDSHSDHGTHDVFNDLKDTGVNDDLMSEADTGAAGGPNSFTPTAYSSGSYPWTNPVNALTEDTSYATATATLVTYRGVGTMAHGTTGTFTPSIPAPSANDICILYGTTYTGGTLTITATGSITTWNALTGSPVDVAAGDKLYVWWGRFSSGSTGPTLQASADHGMARIISYYNCYTSNSPIDVVATGSETTSDTTMSFATGLTTTYNNERVVCIFSTTYDPTSDSTAAFSAEANGNLGSVTERTDNDVNEGNGGGAGTCDGSLITAGAVGTFTATYAYASPKAYIAFALRSTVPNNAFDEIYDTFGIGGTGTVTKVEVGYEAYSSVSGEKLNFYTTHNGGSSWNSVHTSAGLGTSDPGTLTWIDVTSDTTWDWAELNDINYKMKVVSNWVSVTPIWYLDFLQTRVTYLIVNYELNLEMSFTSADFSQTSEELCVKTGTHASGSEGFNVQVWNGAWNTVKTGLSWSAWNNVSVSAYLTSATLYVLFIGQSESGDTTQDTFNIDSVLLHVWTDPNYELDLEGQWISADYDETNEELCIYAGTQDAEALKVEVRSGGSWVTLIADLTASVWTNVSVTTYLTSSTFTIRFLGGTESSDTIQSSWNVDCALLHTWTSNQPPVNGALPACVNLDDTDNLYPRYKEYTFTANTTDPEGATDINYVELSFQADWTWRYTEATNEFIEQSGASNTQLVTGDCSYVKSGPKLNLTFRAWIEWACTDSVNYDLTIYTVDDSANSDSDTNTANDYDVLTSVNVINIQVVDSVGTTTRGPLSSTLSGSSAIRWTDETSLHPAESIIDVYMIQADVPGSPWAMNYAQMPLGSATCNPSSDDAVGSKAYECRVVAKGDGAGGTSRGNGYSSGYIADRMIVNDMTTDDGRINVQTDSSDHVQLKYEYDSAWVSTGSVTINGRTGTYSGSNGWWNFGDNKYPAQKVTYDSVSADGSDTHGIDTVFQNGKSIDQIWDRSIMFLNVVDGRIDISTQCMVYAIGYLEYDTHWLGSGDTVTLQTYGAMTWNLTSSRFEYQRSESSVGQLTFDMLTCVENTYLISAFFQNNGLQHVIWDRDQVQSYTTNDTVGNTNQYSRIYARLFYDYDDTPITDGSVTINGTAATYNGSAGWWWIDVTKSSPQNATYNTVALSGNSYGITAIDQNGKSQTVTFTRVKINTTTVNDSDHRTGWAYYVKVSVTAELEVITHVLGSGDTITLDGQAMTWNATSGAFELLVTKSATANYTFFVNSTSEASYGITSLNLNSQSSHETFDRALFTLNINKGWTVIGYNVTVSYSGHFEYDNDTFTGTVDSGGFGSYPTFYTAGNQSVTITAILTEPKYGVFAFSSNTAYCVWDTVIAVSGPAYFWVQYSVSSVWLIWGTSSSYKWQINGTWLAQGAVLASYCNGSTNALAGIWNSVGGFGGLAIGSFSSSWYHANITVNVEITISGTFYDWQIWGQVLAVDIVHTIHIINLGESVEDVWISFYYSTNWGNATLTIWDSMVSNTTPVGYSQWEGGYQIAKPSVIGAHHYTLLINGSHSGASYADQIKNFAASSSWIFQNWTFTVNPVQLSFDSPTFTQNNESVIVGGTVHTSATTLQWTVYEAALGWASGTITGVSNGAYISWIWAKSSSTSTSNFTVTVTDGTYNTTFYGWYLRISANAWVTYGSLTNEYHNIYNMTSSNSTIVYNYSPFSDPNFVIVLVGSWVFIIMIAYRVSKVKIVQAVQKTIREMQRK